jgi:hypothetical protein
VLLPVVFLEVNDVVVVRKMKSVISIIIIGIFFIVEMLCISGDERRHRTEYKYVTQGAIVRFFHIGSITLSRETSV